MIRLLRYICLIFPLLLASASAQNRPPDPSPCKSADQAPECWWMTAEVPSAESFAKDGVELFRFRYGGYNQGSFIFQITKERSGIIKLDTRGLRPRGGEIVYPLEISAWNRIIDRWNKFVADENDFVAQAPERQKAEQDRANKTGMDEVLVCADGYSMNFDVVVDGEVQHRSPNWCGDPLVDNYHDDLFRQIFAQIPYCANLGDEWPWCFSLEGDRYSAAKLIAPLMEFARLTCGDDAEVNAIRNLVAPNATISIEGVSDPRVAERYVQMHCGDQPESLFLDEIEGRPDTVIVTGMLSYSLLESGKEPTYFERPYRQIWSKGNSSDFRISSWEIGKQVETKNP